MLNRRMKVIIKYRSASSIFPVKKNNRKNLEMHTTKRPINVDFSVESFNSFFFFFNFIINFVFLSTKFISSAGTEII